MISLSSEMTDRKGRRARGWLFFDAECKFCTRIARCLAKPMARKRLAMAPLQDPRVPALLGVPREDLLRAVRFVAGDGARYAGADALLALAQELWWAKPLVYLAKLPGMLATLRAGYRWSALRWRCRAQH